MAETQQLTVRLDLEGNLTSGIAKAQRQLGGLGTSVARVGKGVGQVGAGLARAGLLVGGAAVAGITAAAKAGIEFEDAFAGVRKTVNETDLTKAGLSFEKLATAFRAMSTEIPIAATDFARLGETAGALGIKAADIEEFVRVTAMLGVTTDLTADQAADSLGRIGTILKFTGQDYEDFADSLVALGNAGASTESEIIEISKRFAAEGEAAGLATEEIAGLASATASLGFAPERGGTALARVFANMSTNIAVANDKGKAFAKTTGRSIKDLQRDLNRGKGLQIFQDFLRGLKGLNAVDAARVLKAAGITNTSDRTIFRTMADNLPFVNEQLEIAKNATGALLEEATKKFATTASKIQLFKNNVIEAGITLSEGFLPAVGRALDKLSSLFRDPATKGDIAQLGKDIGKAIDDIDWDDVMSDAREFAGVLKTTLGITLDILKAINALPTELKAAAAAFVVLNKASGGLIASGVGNVVGGLAETAIRGIGSRIPKVGALFAQPVFVTNWPLGGLGGGLPGAGGGGGGLKGLLKATIIGAVVVEGFSQWAQSVQGFVEANNEQGAKGLTAGEIEAQKYYNADKATQDLIFKRLGRIPAREDWISGLAKLNKPAGGGKDGVVPVRLVGDQPDRTDPAKIAWRNEKRDKAATAVENLKRDIGPSLSKTPIKLDIVKTSVIEAGLAAKNASLETKTAATAAGVASALAAKNAGSTTATATRGVAPPIVGAIQRNRPMVTTIVNVTATHVTKSTTIQNRYGPGSGSGGVDTGHAVGTGPLP